VHLIPRGPNFAGISHPLLSGFASYPSGHVVQAPHCTVSQTPIYCPAPVHVSSSSHLVESTEPFYPGRRLTQAFVAVSNLERQSQSLSHPVFVKFTF